VYWELWAGGWQKRMKEGVNLTMICLKNFGKCHNIPPLQIFLKIAHWFCPICDMI
jgi:hypothetical protein